MESRILWRAALFIEESDHIELLIPKGCTFVSVSQKASISQVSQNEKEIFRHRAWVNLESGLTQTFFRMSYLGLLFPDEGRLLSSFSPPPAPLYPLSRPFNHPSCGSKWTNESTKRNNQFPSCVMFHCLGLMHGEWWVVSDACDEWGTGRCRQLW